MKYAPCYSSSMQDDFTAELQSDEFASEYEAYLDEMEKKYWAEIDARAN